ncbi:zinc finger BED domain-containing protein 5-like [Macrobrachium nipponense]|uniref:zinc finger BED domain-containing protein 5-like n=1 Tax=Macrobrachium nipponense TaxID=159736 RepID=UPI0030C8B4DC
MNLYMKITVLLVFVRYVSDESVHEDLLLCQALETTTRGEDIFKILATYFRKNDLNWNLCIAVCTDGAKAMTGSVKGVIGLIKNVAPAVEHRHCCLHREALAVKKMLSDLKETINEVIKVVNFIKAKPLHSRVFASLCQEMGPIHITLLLHTEVRWLSRGKILSRVYELRNEIEVFLREHKSSLLSHFTDEVWVCKVAYLADIFWKFKELSLS